jgi:hypothetical protein
MGIAVLAAGSPAFGTEPRHFLGTWHGEQSGAEVVWQFDLTKLKLDGRRADWKVSGDSLVVEFEPLGDSATGERAVYHFVVSDPSSTYRRLFLYGFDLGQAGLLLTREMSDGELARLQAAVKIGGQAAAGPASAPPVAAPPAPAPPRP